MTGPGFDLHQIAASVRFVQGYRFLDRCGETLIALEDCLDPGWIPGDTSPKAGVMVNHELGMVAQFHSAALSVSQSEFLDFTYFHDQACKILDVLIDNFGIKRIHAPSLKVVWQKGFEEVDAAERFVRGLRLCPPPQKAIDLLGGDQTGLSFVVCTECTPTWQGISVVQRRRLEAKTVLQEKQPSFDDRLMKRTRLLSQRQRDAMAALAKLRRQHPAVSRIAAELDVEHSFETEFSTSEFDFPTFLQEARLWHEQIPARVLQGAEGQ